jgi:hypothetical protein
MTDQTHNGEMDANRPGEARDAQSSLAASNSVDVGRLISGESDSEPLMPGEDPTSKYVDDVEHWVNVYSELLDFKRFMLDGATVRAREMRTETARKEVEDTDLRVARAEAERFTRRLAYWRGRLDAIQATKAEPVPAN